MAYKIDTDLCTSCDDCLPECPTASISVKKGMYVINANECTECEGDFDKPQCVKVCPIKGCITQIAA
ncbi:MAG: 4Fe-4S binding protein [Gammaproteobacteria bacterium]|nr:4Fe-4S binding protein [Gammaproteobacteria bacterium]MDD2929615.1 4Fe-4S binding protein [Sideroxydans sp.]